MRTKIVIGLMCIAAILVWTGVAGAQAATPAPKVQLPGGETVWDLSGDWDTFNENYGTWARYGTYPNVYRITQTGSTFSAIRLKNNPPPSVGQAGSPSLQGELDKNGFKRVEIVGGAGEILPCKGQISEDGKKIIIDDGVKAKVTLSRSGDRTPLVGMWRLVSFRREYQATGEREYPMGQNPTGYILFLPEGRMAVVITGEGRKAPTTDQDRVGLFNSLVAYTGPYRVDGEKWITTVEVSANPAWVGTEQTRAFEISGDRLQEMTAWAARPDNRMARAVITYERMK
jgi:Lipocalin-like domain